VEGYGKIQGRGSSSEPKEEGFTRGGKIHITALRADLMERGASLYGEKTFSLQGNRQESKGK